MASAKGAQAPPGAGRGRTVLDVVEVEAPEVLGDEDQEHGVAEEGHAENLAATSRREKGHFGELGWAVGVLAFYEVGRRAGTLDVRMCHDASRTSTIVQYATV